MDSASMALRGCCRVGGVGGGGTICSCPTCWTRSTIAKDGVSLGGCNVNTSSVKFSSISIKAASGSSTIVRLDELGCIDRLSKARLSDVSGERGGGISGRSGGGVTLRQMKDVKASDRISWCMCKQAWTFKPVLLGPVHEDFLNASLFHCNNTRPPTVPCTSQYREWKSSLCAFE